MEVREIEKILKDRFENNMERHPGISRKEVIELINPEAWEILKKMEEAGGQVDLLAGEDGSLIFVDTCKETPQERRSVCYDEEARLSRKKFPPENSALGMAKEIGADLMDEKTYYLLQKTGKYDEKGQVRLGVDEDFRKTGDGLFANRRHDRVFVYYNGAQSYYKTRGFRSMLKIR
jgi:hypothetical protein